MTMALKLNIDLQNFVVCDLSKALSGSFGTSGTGVVRFYGQTQPVNADESTAGCTQYGFIINVCWGSSGMGATSGTAALGSAGGMTGTSTATGTASWARFERYGTNHVGSAATFRLDGDVGTGATCAFIVNSPIMTVGGAITLISMPLSVG
jgi:hypothetical protein